ncbi:MAG: hypothetical protein AB1725_05420 [Armatimonadota bacterium]
MRASMMYADANDLVALADRHDGPSILHELVARMIAETASSRARSMHFRTGSGISLTGWDGQLEIDDPIWPLPGGRSYWELSADQNVKRKANEDYSKRTTNTDSAACSSSTFVFCTLRRWRDVGTWENSKRSQCDWHNVVALDADGLYNWLLQCPGTHLWISQYLGKAVSHAQPVEVWWQDKTWKLPTDVLLHGYDEEVGSLVQFLRGEPRVVRIQWESPELALAFAAACLCQPGHEDLMVRGIVVRNQETLDDLVGRHQGLILLADFEPNSVEYAVTTRGHHVVIGTGPRSTIQPEIKVPLRVRTVLDEAFAQWRPRMEDRLRWVDRAFRKFLLVWHEIRQSQRTVEWDQEDAVPFLLACSWRTDDQTILSHVFGEERLQKAFSYANQEDPFLRQHGEVFRVVDVEEAWSFLAKHVKDPHLACLQKLVRTVFTGSCPIRCSRDLASGVAATLCWLGACGGTVNENGSQTGASVAVRLIDEILSDAEQRRRFVELAPWLPDLAEGAPEEFLSALERLLHDQPDQLEAFFQDRHGESHFFSDTPHTYLLWALERLAWDRLHLARAAKCLLCLAGIDPGGFLSNRPLVSLREVFLPWFPGTQAGVDDRSKVLHQLCEGASDSAWRLLAGLWPQGPDSATSTAIGRFRSWGPLWRADPTHRDVHAASNRIVEIAVEIAGSRGDRWTELIRAVAWFPNDGFEKALGRLRDLANDNSLSEEAQDAIWEAMRAELAMAEAYAQEWPLQGERVAKYREVWRLLSPSSCIVRHSWMFDRHAVYQLGPGSDWRAKHKDLLERHAAAAREVWEQFGFEGILALAQRCDMPSQVGFALASALDRQEIGGVVVKLWSGGGAYEQCALGLLGGMAALHGAASVTAFAVSPESEGLDARSKAKALQVLEPSSEVLDALAQLGKEASTEYWKSVQPVRTDSPEVLETVSRNLVEHGAIECAITTLWISTSGDAKPDAHLVLEVLERAATADLTPWQTTFHEIAHLLDYACEVSADAARIARAELAFADRLIYIRNPKVFPSMVREDPEIFVELVASVYKPVHASEGEPPLPPVDSASAWFMLRQLDAVPGQKGDVVDHERLRKWTEKGRELADKSGHLAMFDQTLGQWLAKSPIGSDGIFPHEAAREIIEHLQSENIDTGFIMGVLNSRGVFMKDPDTGGEQERHIEQQYRGWGSSLAARWPRTARILGRVADTYAHQARSEDLQRGL